MESSFPVDAVGTVLYKRLVIAFWSLHCRRHPNNATRLPVPTPSRYRKRITLKVSVKYCSCFWMSKGGVMTPYPSQLQHQSTQIPSQNVQSHDIHFCRCSAPLFDPHARPTTWFTHSSFVQCLLRQADPSTQMPCIPGCCYTCSNFPTTNHPHNIPPTAFFNSDSTHIITTILCTRREAFIRILQRWASRDISDTAIMTLPPKSALIFLNACCIICL